MSDMWPAGVSAASGQRTSSSEDELPWGLPDRAVGQLLAWHFGEPTLLPPGCCGARLSRDWGGGVGAETEPPFSVRTLG